MLVDGINYWAYAFQDGPQDPLYGSSNCTYTTLYKMYNILIENALHQSLQYALWDCFWKDVLIVVVTQDELLKLWRWLI